MKQLCLSLGFTLSVIIVNASFADTTKLYHPDENAANKIAETVKQAKKENKQVLIQAGGNWCSWCLEFNAMTTGDKQLDSAIHAEYVVYHLNYSKENKNYEVFKKYGFPQRFGFPVFLILDNNGTLIHTENSAYLEKGKSYDKNKILEFLGNWRRDAMAEHNYQSDKQ